MSLILIVQGGSDYSPSTQPFAIDNISIGRSCPNFCSGHGLCSVCICLESLNYISVIVLVLFDRMERVYAIQAFCAHHVVLQQLV